MKKLELAVHNLLKNNPLLKDIVKYSYQTIVSLFVKKKVLSVGPLYTRENTFFGFHDKSPWSPSGEYLLAHCYEGKGSESSNKIGKIDIAIFSGKGWTKKHVVTETNAWNWQQGSQLQWVNDSRFIFNDFKDGVCIARIVDIHGEEIYNLPYPIGAISPKAKVYASFCYESFGQAMPGYGYDFNKNISIANVKPLELVVGSINDMSELSVYDCSELGNIECSNNNNGLHFISHTQFSNSGKYLAFMKRFSSEGSRLKSELFLLNRETNKISRFPFKDMISHYCFIDETNLLAYANTETDGDGFYLVDIESLEYKNVTHLLNDRDGHPNSSENGIVVFDTYPDGTRHQELYLWFDRKSKAQKIATIYAPLSFKNMSRVDLHPRINPDGNYICFDSSFTNVRSLTTMELQRD